MTAKSLPLRRIVDPRLHGILPLAFFATLIEMGYGDQSLSVGTATYVSLGDEYYLVTNQHNLTGRSPDTRRIISSTGGVPDRLTGWFLNFRQPEPGVIEYSLDFWTSKTVPLYDQEGRSRWFVHPAFDDIDLACLPFERKGGLFPALKLDGYSSPPDIRPDEPVEVIGYPRGEPSNMRLPQIANGMLVSLNVPADLQRPRFLIDAPTLAGSSGSPVLGFTGYTSRVNGFDNEYYMPERRVLGIYSGRLRTPPDALPAPLYSHGQVWYLQAVVDALRSRQRGIDAHPERAT